MLGCEIASMVGGFGGGIGTLASEGAIGERCRRNERIGGGGETVKN